MRILGSSASIRRAGPFLDGLLASSSEDNLLAAPGNHLRGVLEAGVGDFGAA
jgi:hypothetical protein